MGFTLVVPARAALSILCALTFVLAAAGPARADVVFDHAFGFGVDTGAAAFETCTAASGCQAGTASDAAGGMDTPAGVAVDPRGRIVVADEAYNRLVRFAVASDGTVSFERAFGIDVDPSDGNTGDFESCTTASGCQAGVGSGAAGGLNAPIDVAFDAQGQMLVSNRINNRIDRFAVAGDGTVSFDRAFGVDVDPSDGNTGDFENCTTTSGCRRPATSAAAGGMNAPAGVAVDAQGRILVPDLVNNRIDRFAVAGDGTVSFDRAFGVDVDPSDGNTGDFENCTTASGCQAAAASGAAGGIEWPLGVAVDAQGRILVSDGFNYRIDRFAVAGDGTVNFDRAFGVDVDPSDGNTGDFENCTTATGCRVGTRSAAAGAVAHPEGLAVDAHQRILSADADNDRISVFRPERAVTVTSGLVPASDAGRFDLRVNGALARGSAGNGDSGYVFVDQGAAATIAAQAATGTSLADYDTTIDCGGGPQPGTNLTIPAVTADVACTITNSRKPAPPPVVGPVQPITLAISHRTVRRVGRWIELGIHCRGPEGKRCEGTLALDPARGRTRLAAAGRYGRVRFSAAAGENLTIRVRATSRLRKALRKRRRVISTVTATFAGHDGAQRTVKRKITIVEPRRKR
jgi:hypothetical protein